jgi:hypothetical protein
MKKLFHSGMSRLLPLMLVVIMLAGLMPIMASAAEGHVIITPGTGSETIEAGGSVANTSTPANVTESKKKPDTGRQNKKDDRDHNKRGHDDNDSDKRSSGYKNGYDDGYDDGYTAGMDKGTDKSKVVIINGYSPLPDYGSENDIVGLTSSGPSWARAGEIIRFTFPEIKNKTEYPLPGFYWRCEIATEAVSVLSVNTGAWSGEGTYSFWVKSNKRDWRKVYTSLKRSTAYSVDMSASKLGLGSNEYVTDIMLDFGTVGAGFQAKKTPCVDVQLKSDAVFGHKFVNYSDAGARDGNYWVYDREKVTTTIYREYGAFYGYADAYGSYPGFGPGYNP